MTRSSSEPQQAEEALKELHQALAGLYGCRLKKAILSVWRLVRHP